MVKSGKIDIRLSLSCDGFVSIKVKDEGNGIGEEELANIFKPFFTTKSTGTGLGLSHAYEVMEAHGGKIEVESMVGNGTIFNFLLPLQVAS